MYFTIIWLNNLNICYTIILMPFYLFLDIYFVSFKVIVLGYNTLVPLLFPIFQAFLICAWAVPAVRVVSTQSQQISILSWVFSVSRTRKSRRSSTRVNMVLFLAKKSWWKAIDCFAPNTGFMHHANSVYVENNISYWSYELVARSHDASRASNRLKQSAKHSHLTLLVAFVGMFGFVLTS